MTLLFGPFAPLSELAGDPDRHARGARASRSLVPAADVVATEDEVTVVMDMPGLKAEDLEIELVDDVLTVRGERAFPYSSGQEEGRVWQRLERGFGAFERVLRVPKGLEAEGIQASMTDGVLTLHIPMPQPPEPRRIAISTRGGHPTLEHEPAAEEEEREPAGAGG